MWRDNAPHVLTALVRRFGDFDAAEDACQEALIAAARHWPADGVPDNPRGWLITAASRVLIDRWRAEEARAERELLVGHREPDSARHAPEADDVTGGDDDSLALLFLCCHPALTRPSQVALTLRAVGGLTTAQIARGFLVPEATMAQRISRAKRTLREAGARFVVPAPDELPARVAAVAQVLYLIFTEGHLATAGPDLTDPSLAAEAIRLTRQLHARLPAAGEVTGLLALMLLTDARRAARTDARGGLVPLADQDRSAWDRAQIVEGVGLVEGVLPVGQVGPYQLQAAIAAVHAEAATAQETDWQQIVTLYGMLADVAPGPMVTLNRAVAVAQVDGPDAALAMVEPLLSDPQLRHHHRLHAVQAHLLELAGRTTEARAAYGTAARLTTSLPEQRFLNARVQSLGPDRAAP